MTERDLFIAALDLAGAQQRTTYLDRACAGNETMRSRIEALLAAHERAENFLQQPAIESATGMAMDVGTGPNGRDQPRSAEHQFDPTVFPVLDGPGTHIGRYKLLQQIGEGGFGIVYLAQQVEPVRRKVALKIIRPGMDSREVIARFEAERQVLAMMEHANIAHVLDAGTTDNGRPYFAMELVKGVPITEYCDANHCTTRVRLELFCDVCRAVAHAHQKGIIHRDLKPSNIMVTLHDSRPVPKVIDFGVAKALCSELTQQSQFTTYGQLIGTPAYMSPEQAEMSGLGVDTRSDIYSLGVLLYELLTGRTPLDTQRILGTRFTELQRIIREDEPRLPSTRLEELRRTQSTSRQTPSVVKEISDTGSVPVATGATAAAGDSELGRIASLRRTDPQRLVREVAGDLDWIVMKAIDKDRSRRYETASSLVADVQRHLRDEPVEAAAPSALYRLRKFARRHKPAFAGALALVVAIFLALVGLSISNVLISLEKRAKDIALVQKDNAIQERESALVAARKSEQAAKDQLFESLLNQARAGRFSRQMGQRLNSLDALAQAARIRPDERLRDEAIAAMALSDVRRGPSWHAAPPGIVSVSYDELYERYARIDKQGVISIRRISDDQEVQRIASSPGRGYASVFSPDGRFYAKLEADNTLRVWRVADGQPVLHEAPRSCWRFAFGADGRQLAVIQQSESVVPAVVRFDLATGLETNRWQLSAKANTLAFHPDNRQLAVGYYDSSIVSVYDAVEGTVVADLPVGRVQEQVVAWHPDGERLAISGSDPRIQIWNVAQKERLAILEGHVQHVTQLSFHPGGELLASTGWEGVTRLWHPSTGRQLMQLPMSETPRFSSDGRWLGVAWHGEQAELLEIAPTGEYQTIVSNLGGGQIGYYGGDISPDGRLLAVGVQDATCLWDLLTGREVAMLPGHAKRATFGSNPARPELLVSSLAGLHRWPITTDGPAAHRLRLGPPQLLLSAPNAEFASRRDGQVVLTADGRESIQIIDMEHGDVQNLGTHAQAHAIAVSPDGRWGASTGWHSDRVRLWNVPAAKMVHEWAVGERNYVFFTPDSRNLIISRGDEFSFWDVESLQAVRTIRRDVALFPGWVSFSPDGGLMALEMAPGVIHLKEVATARTVARLEDPQGDRAREMYFTPDGLRLAAIAGYARAIHIWDLRAIRVRLKALGLDWDWPEFPPAPRAERPLIPLEIRVVRE